MVSVYFRTSFVCSLWKVTEVFRFEYALTDLLSFQICLNIVRLMITQISKLSPVSPKGFSRGFLILFINYIMSTSSHIKHNLFVVYFSWCSVTSSNCVCSRDKLRQFSFFFCIRDIVLLLVFRSSWNTRTWYCKE